MLHRRTIALALSALLLAAGLTIIGLALSGAGPEQQAKPRFIGDPVGFVVPTARPEPTLEPPPPEPTPEPSRAAVERLLIPRIGVDAPIVVLGVDADGVMQDPKDPRQVAWYHFSAQPGWRGNAVFAGHVDYANYGPAVFWRLRELQPEDEIRVRLADGASYSYRVISLASFSAQDAPVQEIVGPTDNEVVTLITCGGAFDPRAREYDRRLIVRAERVPEPSAVGR